MYTGTVWGITLIVIGFLLSLGALQLVTTATAPGLVGQASRNLDRASGWKLAGLFGLGAVLILLWIGALTAFSNGGPFLKLLAFPGVLLGALAIAPSFAATSLCIGGRLPDPRDETSPWRQLVRGATALGLSWAVPFVGWFVILPVTLAIGMSAVVFSVFQSAGRADAGRAFLLRASEASEAAV
jgi:hypothetical protein